MRRTAAAILGLGAALALAGCGTGGRVTHGDITHGKQVFLDKCQTCHTLADAGSTGTRGPNLDTAFAFMRDAANAGDRFCGSTIENVVRDQIRFPSHNDIPSQYVMPADLVKGRNADDVAAYVASVAGAQPGKQATAQPQSSKCT